MQETGNWFTEIKLELFSGTYFPGGGFFKKFVVGMHNSSSAKQF